MNPIKLIATYSRVSTSAQEEQETIKTQLNTLQEFADKNNYKIIKQYIDDGWSGDVLMRPDLDKLRQDAKDKLWDAVLIYDPDRLARRYSYQELVMDELREAGIEIIFVTISSPKNSEDKILYGVRGLFAEYERAKISERFRLGKIRKVKEGHVLLSEAPYGYNYIPRKDNLPGYIEINPNEARVVKMLFKWIVDEGLTQRKIIKRLQELDIKPRKSTRGVWSSSTLTTLLKNKTYIGEAHWGGSYAVIPENPRSNEKYRKNKKSSRKNKPESEWYKIPVPPIIDTLVFEAARKQIESNFNFNKRNTKNEYLLSGKIYCSCGSSRTGEGPQNGKYLYYRCSNRVLSFPLPATCHEKGINAKIADSLVWDKISKLMSSPKLLLAQAERWRSKQQPKFTFSTTDVKTIQEEIKKLEIEENRYTKAYGSGLFSIEQLSEYVTPVREKITLLNNQILKSKQEEKENNVLVLPNQIQIEEFTLKAKEILQNLSFEVKKSIIFNVIEKITGTPNKLVICGFIPITTNNNVEFFSSHRNGVSANRQENVLKRIPFEFLVDLPPPNVIIHFRKNE